MAALARWPQQLQLPLARRRRDEAKVSTAGQAASASHQYRGERGETATCVPHAGKKIRKFIAESGKRHAAAGVESERASPGSGQLK
jgi:hypothetical protein